MSRADEGQFEWSRDAIEVDVRGELQRVVDRHLEELTARDAVDEGNGDVLDGLIDHTVAKWKFSFSRRLLARAKELQALLEQAEKRRLSAVESITELEATARAAAKRISDLPALMVSDSVQVPGGADAGFDVQQLREFVKAERTYWEATQAAAVEAARRSVRRHVSRTTKIRSGAQIAGIRGSAGRRRDAAEKALTEAEAALARAEEELYSALAQLRGSQARVRADATRTVAA